MLSTDSKTKIRIALAVLLLTTVPAANARTKYPSRAHGRQRALTFSTRAVSVHRRQAA